ncbi:MAG: efflux RND transporter periplasmic adaptor subunit [Planctomycetia bacterium]|nr:efflux RND transporter periplasmic adaptor subunit [Planctomycetia bacterium]
MGSTEQSRPVANCRDAQAKGAAAPPSARAPRRGAVAQLLVVALILPVAALGTMLAWSGKFTFSKKRDVVIETGVVKRGMLEVKVTERGNVDSANNLTLRSQVEGGLGTTILKIVDEGAIVKPGQVVVELDSAKLREELLAQQIRLDAAVAALKNAEADCHIQQMQNESDVAAAELKLHLARLDLIKYSEGDYTQELRIVAGEIKIAAEYMVRATERWGLTAQLLRKGYTTTKMLDADRVAMAKAKIDLSAVREKQHVLEGYTHKRQIAELEANVAFHEREIGRVRLRCEAMLTQRDRSLLSRKRTHLLENERLKKIQSQVAACTIRSPREGMVVFANMLDGGRSAPTPLIYEGATVRERQPLIQLPDLTRMQVNARVHESKIAMLEKGQEVTVQVDALKDEVFHGVIDQVALVPNSASWPNVNLKEYMTSIRLTDDIARLSALKPGMTAEVEILVDRLDAVVQAPIQACVERGGRYFAWVVDEESEYKRHEIRLGRSNETETEILDGLAEGDAVVLNPRGVLPEQVTLLEQEIALVDESIWAQPAAARPRPADPAPARPREGDVKPKAEEPPPRSPGAPEPAPILIVASLPETGKPQSQIVNDPMAVFDRLDQNHDSKVSAAELPDPMKPVMERLDTNGDHMIDKEEWKKGTCTVPPPRSELPREPAKSP